jgi:glycosyltransferase involved in cell wall biosynthesis
MLVNLINRFNLKNFKITLVSLSQDNPLLKRIRPETVNFFSFPRKWRYDFYLVWQLHNLIESEGIETVLVFGTFEYVFLRLALLGLPNLPQTYISIHSTQWKLWRLHVQHFLYARLLTGSEKIISVCNAQKNYWIKAYLIARNRFVTIYNGVDVDYFSPTDKAASRLQIRSQFGIPSEAFVLLQVASFQAYKRHEDAFQSLRRLKDNFPHIQCHLLLVGGGTAARETELRSMAQSLNIADRVIFCGIQDDVRPFYKAADIFTLTSAWGETFSVAALEAMSMGLPCVLTDVSGAREMIQENCNGFLVESGNPENIAKGWKHAIDVYQQFDAVAIRQNIVDKFNLDKCAHQYQDLLNKYPIDEVLPTSNITDENTVV